MIIIVTDSLGSRKHVLHLLSEQASKKNCREGHSAEAVTGRKEEKGEGEGEWEGRRDGGGWGARIKQQQEKA